MKSRIVFAEQNFCIVDFYHLLKECEVHIINDLHKYGLLNQKKITKDAKTLILHHLTLSVCEYVLKHKNKEKNVIYYSVQLPREVSLVNFYNPTDLSYLLEKIIDKFKKNLPIRIHKNHLLFKEIIESKNGDKNEIIASIKITLEKTDFSQFSFSKTLQFAKRHGLTFLNKEYFNSIKTKQLLMG